MVVCDFEAFSWKINVSLTTLRVLKSKTCINENVTSVDRLAAGPLISLEPCGLPSWLLVGVKTMTVSQSKTDLSDFS